MGPFPQQGIQDGNHRNHQEHTENAHELSADADGEQHPHTGKANGGTHHLGVNHVALNLLNHQEHNHKPEGLHRVGNQNQECANDAAGPGTHHRDKGGDRHQHADEGNIGHPENGHGNGEKSAQNADLNALSGQEVGEGGVAQPQHLHHVVRMALFQESIGKLSSLPGQYLLLEQGVNCKDDGDKGIHQHTHKAANGGQGRGQNGRQAVAHQGQALLHQSRPIQFAQLRIFLNPLHELGILRQCPIHPRLYLFQECRDCRVQRSNGLGQLGNQQGEYRRDHQSPADKGQKQCNTPAKARFLYKLKMPLKKPHGHIENKGNHRTHNKGRQGANAKAPHTAGKLGLVQKPV